MLKYHGSLDCQSNVSHCVSSHVVTTVFQHPTLAVTFYVFCLYLFRPARDFTMLTTILRAWSLLRKGFSVICANTSDGAEESLWRLCQGEGTAFPRGLPLPLPSCLLQQPERVERE